MLTKTCVKTETPPAYVRSKSKKEHRFFVINLANVVIKFITVIIMMVNTSATLLPNTINFNGKWTINISKSNFDSLKNDIAPKEIIAKQSRDSIVLNKTFEHPGSAPNSFTQTFLFNGKPSERMAGGVERRVTSIVTSRDSLIFNTHGYVDNKGLKWEYKATEWWTLSADGKALTIQRKAVLPDRTEIYTAVYDKE